MSDQAWQDACLGELIDTFEAGVSVRSTDGPAANSEHGVLKVSCVSREGFRPSENKLVIDEDLRRVGPSISRGDLILTRANTLELVGRAVTVDDDFPHLHLSDKHWRVVLQEEKAAHLGWLKYMINSPRVRRALMVRATGTSGSMKNISQREFLKIRVPYPPFDVQQRIHAVLEEWECANRQLEDLIAAKRCLKRGLMQQLLTGQRRFKEFDNGDPRKSTWFGNIPATWSYPAMEEIAVEVKMRAGPGFEKFSVISCTKYEGLVDSLEYFGKKVFGDDRSNYKVVERAHFAYPSNHIEEGSIGLLHHRDRGVVSPIYTVFEVTADVLPEYLYLVFKTEKCRHLFASGTNASVNRRGSLRWREFRKLRLPIPSRPEQEAIVTLARALQSELDLLRNLRNALDRQRRGVMELLLTGTVRVHT